MVSDPTRICSGEYPDPVIFDMPDPDPVVFDLPDHYPVLFLPDPDQDHDPVHLWPDPDQDHDLDPTLNHFFYWKISIFYLKMEQYFETIRVLA